MNIQDVHLQNTGPRPSTPCGFSHIAIPSRNLAQSKQFFIEVLGGNMISEGQSSTRIQFGSLGIILAPQSGGATPADAEYPHYAFTVVRRGISAGGNYAPDVKALNYQTWKDPGQ